MLVNIVVHISLTVLACMISGCTLGIVVTIYKGNIKVDLICLLLKGGSESFHSRMLNPLLALAGLLRMVSAFCEEIKHKLAFAQLETSLPKKTKWKKIFKRVKSHRKVP